MSAKEIIESGNLELYVAGVLCGRERDEISARIKKDAVLQQEVKAIEQVMLGVLNEGKYMPRPQLKKDIFAALKEQKALDSGKKEDFILAESAATGKVVEMNPVNRWLAAASIVLLIGFGATAIIWNQKIGSQHDEITALDAKYNSQLELNSIHEKAISKYEQQLALINDIATKKIILNGLTAFPDSKAVVYWNSDNGKVFVDPANLPAAPANKQYQLWALLDGKPLDAGVFNTDKDSAVLQEVKNIAKAQAFAITLEQKGGVSSPTISAMYVMGTI